MTVLTTSSYTEQLSKGVFQIRVSKGEKVTLEISTQITAGFALDKGDILLLRLLLERVEADLT